MLSAYCSQADEAMLLFGKSVSYLLAKKKKKEKEVLGRAASPPSARKEKDAKRDSKKEKEREKEREKEKKREPPSKYFRITSTAPVRQTSVSYAAGVALTLSAFLLSLSLSPSVALR